MFHVKQSPEGRPERGWEEQLAALTRCLGELHIPLSQAQAELVAAYARLVFSWNRRLNLIARGDEPVFVRRHVGESLAFAANRAIRPGAWVLDMGSGAGLPGIPLKILRPDLHAVLLEAHRRKALFLQEAVEHLGLGDIEVLCARAEYLATHHQWQGRFQLVAARAVAPLPKLWLWAAPLLAQEGELLALKGGDLSRELRQLGEVDTATVVRVETPPACLVDPSTARVLVTIHRGART
ncbi:MAG: 16S rRNA (guanine(527)-N(7))-methyltransferase RsmG [candidate division KSB1 bacterium]|nr:16S rRNA (guanine(527)-N(7))-methyltransferase RsmG [candidate division KSB1 bacterium]